MATEEAVAFKNEGNKAFAAHDWPTAIDFYTKAINLDDKQPTYYSNRAQVRSRPAYKHARVTNESRHTSDPKPMDMP
jgi:serine/threonine-protein phosphatase 5